jgi:molybdate transport system substrate-binding protein
MRALRILAVITFSALSSSQALADSLRVFSLPGLKGVVEELGPDIERASGTKVTFQYGTLQQARDRIEANDYDVMIYASPLIKDLINAGKLEPSAPVVISHIKIGVAVRAGAPVPLIATGDRFKAAILNAKSISYTKDSPAGVYLSSLMQRDGARLG